MRGLTAILLVGGLGVVDQHCGFRVLFLWCLYRSSVRTDDDLEQIIQDTLLVDSVSSMLQKCDMLGDVCSNLRKRERERESVAECGCKMVQGM